MTYDTQENSAWLGAPRELWEFTVSNLSYRYTSADSSKTHNDNVYTPTPITRSSLNHGPQQNKAELKITVPGDNPVAMLFMAWAPAAIVLVTLFQLHEGESEYRVGWIGRVLGVSWPGKGEAVLNCEPISSSLRRYGLTRTTGVACPVTLYNSECGVSRSAYEANGTVLTISGDTITTAIAGDKANGYYAGGFMGWMNDDGLTLYRTIMEHTGTALKLIYPMSEIPIGAAITIVPGCKKNWSDCDNKFNNKNNYRGLKYLPSDINPLNGGKVF